MPEQTQDPLTEKGKKIMQAMKEQYGERGEEVFYRSKQAGTISGVDEIVGLHGGQSGGLGPVQSAEDPTGYGIGISGVDAIVKWKP
jgi:hypothetical protein